MDATLASRSEKNWTEGETKSHPVSTHCLPQDASRAVSDIDPEPDLRPVSAASPAHTLALDQVSVLVLFLV